MRLQGAGAPGTIDATVEVCFGEAEPGVTKIAYDADAVVGGMVGGVGQRMLTSVSKRMAGEFFGNVAAAIGRARHRRPSGAAPARSPSSGAAVRRAVFTAPPRAGRGLARRTTSSRASPSVPGWSLLGVVVGCGCFGRRRR